MDSTYLENNPQNAINLNAITVQDDAMDDESSKPEPQLLDLSDDVLLCILKYCTPQDLKALGHTCHRLGVLICDYTLWQRVDARSAPTGQERMKWFLTHCLSSATKELKLTGYVDRFTRCLGVKKPSADSGVKVPAEEDSSAKSITPISQTTNAVEKCKTTIKEDPKISEMKDSNTPLKTLTQLALQTVVDESTSKDQPNSSNNASNTSASTSNSSNSNSNSGASSSNSSTTNSRSGRTDSKSAIRRSNSNLIALLMSNSSMSNIEDEVECMILHRHGPQFTFNQKLLRNLSNKCYNLTTLMLEYCNLDYKNSSLGDFPHKLKKLSLRGSWCYNVPENSSYLHRIQYRLPELEYLDVSECDWFDGTSLISISKVPNLRELYMKHCRRLTECVEYASLAARQGFKRLRIVDMRGSPVGDPEVSAFGWLPQLEELYCAPPLNNVLAAEQPASCGDVLAPFCELDDWERQVPDYYKCKSPDNMEENEEEEEEKKGESEYPEERYGDAMIQSYLRWASAETRYACGLTERFSDTVCRIRILLKPPLQLHRNQNEFRLYYDILPLPESEDDVPGPSKRRIDESRQQSEVIKRLRLRIEKCRKPGDQRPNMPGPSNSEAGSSTGVPKPEESAPGTSGCGRPDTNPTPMDTDKPIEKRPKTANEACIPGPSRPNTLPNNDSRPNTNDQNERPIDDRPINHRLGRYLRRLYLPALLRGDRQPLVQFFFQPHFVYYLVSDMAVLGFGRAKHDLIYQLHLAHQVEGQELAVRPYQSNLRVLSITGYRDVTNRSLEHLARAAPYLRRLDFSNTRVTPAGVEAFKVLRPNCEVIFNEVNND